VVLKNKVLKGIYLDGKFLLYNFMAWHGSLAQARILFGFTVNLGSLNRLHSSTSGSSAATFDVPIGPKFFFFDRTGHREEISLSVLWQRNTFRSIRAAYEDCNASESLISFFSCLLFNTRPFYRAIQRSLCTCKDTYFYYWWIYLRVQVTSVGSRRTCF
jgi:hypothetical protein